MQATAVRPRAKQTILVVEDNIFVRRLFEFALATDYQVLEASSRAQALQVLQLTSPDLAFIDVGLDESQGGLLLLDEMRNDQRWKDIPVAVVSARSLPHDVQAAKERGANAYLSKPFAVGQLKELAQSLLNRQSSKRAPL